MELQPKDREIYLIDWVATEKQPKERNSTNDGLAVIQADRDAKFRAAEEEEQKKQAELLAKQQKAKLNKDRIAELAKPNDKWKVGKKLMELQSKFPHDRVLERMVKEEFRTNQTFRYPVEYDKFH